MELKAILARVDARLEAVGLSESKASKDAGKPDAIRNMRRAVEKDEGRQGVSTATLNALAPVLQTTAVWLLAGAGPEAPGAGVEAPVAPPGPAEMGDVTPSRARMVEATYGGLIEAGAWREVADFDDIVHDAIYEPAEPDFPHVRLIAFDVRGESMNALQPRAILPGDRLIGLDFEGLAGRVALHTGMIVVVQQSQNGGLLVERSVKQLEVYEDRYEFHPRSTLAKFKPIVVPHDMEPEDGREVRILAWAKRFSNRL